ncbi:VOC family protein [Paenibacillus sp. 843]|uniref:VOC family protein n=1 Tax=Paenibacillus sp. 843 TaxID=3341795 RepID=UPI00372AC5A0
MTNPSKAVKPIPDGYTSVTPWIISRNSAALIELLQQAFQAEELARVYVGDGIIGHAEVRIGDAVVMMFDAKPEWPDSPAYLRLYVEDCDAVYQQALAAGAVSVTEPTSLFFGDRVGRVRDPFGNLWWIQTRMEDLTSEEMERRAQDPEYIRAMAYVAGADIVVKIS